MTCEGVLSDFFLMVSALGWDGLTRLLTALQRTFPRAAEICRICAWFEIPNDEIVTDLAREFFNMSIARQPAEITFPPCTLDWRISRVFATFSLTRGPSGSTPILAYQ